MDGWMDGWIDLSAYFVLPLFHFYSQEEERTPEMTSASRSVPPVIMEEETSEEERPETPFSDEYATISQKTADRLRKNIILLADEHSNREEGEQKDIKSSLWKPFRTDGVAKHTQMQKGAVLRAVARDQILLEVCGRPTSFLTTASSYAKSEDITQAKIFDDQIRGTLPEDTFSKAGT